MLGRSSRSRNVCEGILYTDSNLKASAVIDNLKKQTFTALSDLEQVLILMEKRATDKVLVVALSKYFENGEKVASIKDIEKLLKPKPYATLIKGIKFH